MKKITVDMSYCYGIGSLNHTFDFSNNNMPVALYAPNGMMKTSFARSMDDYSEGRTPKDRVNKSRTSSLSVRDEYENPLSPDSIFVVDSIDEKYESDRISTLLASEDLKTQYDEVYADIRTKKDAFVKKLKAVSGISKDSDVQFCADFGGPISEFLTLLARMEREVRDDKHAEFGEIKYKTLFNEKVTSFIAKEDIANLLQEYTSVYERILDNSKYFKKGVFNHSNAEVIAKNLKTNGWFDGGHAVRLNHGDVGEEIRTEAELAAAIETEKQAILSDESLQAMFAQVDKALSNNELRTLREYLLENPFLVSELNDFQYLRTRVWTGYLVRVKHEYLELIEAYDQSKEKIKKIIEQAESQQTHWEKVIEIFNSRFSVPFIVRVENKGDAVLNIGSPQVAFYFKDENETLKIDRSELDKVLSNGEKRALYILNIIFEVEARRKGEIETLFVIDDIADSFDYKNKYAIVEYLSDIAGYDKFHLLIMTHNFDFYRTARSRLGIYQANKLVASKSEGTISLVADDFTDSPFASWKANLTNPECLIASIPFARNLAEYCGDESTYNTLTSLLHVKPETAGITKRDLKLALDNVFKDGTPAELDQNDSVLALIFDTCDLIVENQQESINLERKIVLAIGIRLRAEEYLISAINNQAFVEALASNQTSKLIKRYRSLGNAEVDKLDTFHQVQLMTPENIHLNSFMFEPILDMSMHHLTKLYQKVASFSVTP